MTSQATLPPVDPRPAKTPGRSVLAADLRINGDIHADGSIEILGEIEGSLRAASLTVAPEGKVTGTVSAGSVDIRGQLNGAVGCNTLSLRSTSQVEADVVYETLAIESGAQVQGTFKRPKA